MKINLWEENAMKNEQKNELTDEQKIINIDDENEWEDSWHPVCRHLTAAFAAGREWEWQEAGWHLTEVYISAGCPPPELENPGYLWHLGNHPLQIAGVRGW